MGDFFGRPEEMNGRLGLTRSRTSKDHRKGMIAAIAVVGLAIAYAGILSLGLASLDKPTAPIEDPWFTILEILIMAIMPAIVTLMAAIHATAPDLWKLRSRRALYFMIMAAVTTMAVHANLLVLRRTSLVGEPWRARLLSFEWPSLPYALDILAWDIFFAMAVLLAAPLFAGSRLGTAIRVALILTGVLALAGLAGPALGDMRLRNIGVVGYAGVFPIAGALMALHFRAARNRGSGKAA
jgi:hypothetical protein